MTADLRTGAIRCERVIGCTSCGKPAALVGDTIPDDPALQSLLLCPWCLAATRPEAFRAFASDTYGEAADHHEAAEQWRKWLVTWQDWADRLLGDLGRQPRHGQHGSAACREIIEQLACLAPGVPRCSCCGCFASRHEVDDEELRECLDCECKQWENQ